MHIKSVRLKNQAVCRLPVMAPAKESSATVSCDHVQGLARLPPSAVSTSASEQSSHLITICGNQNQFYKRRKYNQSTWPNRQPLQSTDCYRQISANCSRHKSNMSQESCSSSWHQSAHCGFSLCHHLRPGYCSHHLPHLHSFVFILCFTILLHCSQAISRTENSSLSSSTFFDPRVSAKCERNLMHITIETENPFNGVVHVRGYRKIPCLAVGNGSLLTTLTVDLLAPSNRPNYCGVHRVKGSNERSVGLVVRLHRALELSDDKHYVITCGNTEFYNKNKNEKLIFQFVDKVGHKITKLYHGERYRIRAEVVSSSQESASASLATTSSYHIYVRNCFIFAGNESDVEFIDANGCPTLSNVLGAGFQQSATNMAELEITSMFKLPGTNILHLQCLVELVENCRFCESTLCPGSDKISKMKTVPALTPEMQMIASTTVYVYEPDQQLAASIQPIQIENCSISLISLSIALGVLLVLMLTVNIFLCTSMSCPCFKQEEPPSTIIEDYDVGFSPYDSYHPLGGSFADSGEHFFSGSHQRQQSPVNSGTKRRDHGGHHHYVQQQPGHMLLTSYSPSNDSNQLLQPQANSGQPHQITQRPTISAVQIIKPGPNLPSSRPDGYSSARHIPVHSGSPSNRQQNIVNETSNHFDQLSPRSIRSQNEYY